MKPKLVIYLTAGPNQKAKRLKTPNKGNRMVSPAMQPA
jgi:hypothetical protein